MNSQVAKIIQVARAEVGYLEKASNSQLDDKSANPGRANFTKYSRDLLANKSIVPNPYSQGNAWCDMFVDWCFIKAFGVVEAKRLLKGWSAYTPTSADLFIKAGQWYTKPEPGDVIFFANTTRINHTGIVYNVDKNYVYTVEGNTSGVAGVVENGGGVHMKRYSLSYERIRGYGRPQYKEDEEMPITQQEFDEKMDIWLANRAKQPMNPNLSTAEFNEAIRVGLSDGTRPQTYATRQEVAIMALRAYLKAKND